MKVPEVSPTRIRFEAAFLSNRPDAIPLSQRRLATPEDAQAFASNDRDNPPTRLGFTVDAKRRKAIGFDIGPSFGSVEDIIGRDMDDRYAGRRRDASDDPRPFCIDRRGHRRFALRFIDRCIGGRIEDEMWRHGRHRARDGGSVGVVGFATGDPDRFYSSISGGLQDFAAELPDGAENQNWPSHAT